MPQDQDFRSQPPLRLEAVAQHADEEEANCDHQSQSCSDSLAAVTPADGVFGSDTHPLNRRRVLDVKELADESLLLLSRGFASREWFYAACQVPHMRPQVVFESTVPQALIALAAS